MAAFKYFITCFTAVTCQGVYSRWRDVELPAKITDEENINEIMNCPLDRDIESGELPDDLGKGTHPLYDAVERGDADLVEKIIDWHLEAEGDSRQSHKIVHDDIIESCLDHAKEMRDRGVKTAIDFVPARSPWDAAGNEIIGLEGLKTI